MEDKTSVNYFHIAFEDYNIQRLVQILQREQFKNKTIVLSSVREMYNWSEIVSNIFPLIDDTLRQFNIQSWIFVVNKTFNVDKHKIPKNIQVVAVDYFALDINYQRDYNNIKFNNNWNSKSSKALLLMGKTGKRNRLPLLYKFVNSGLIEHLEYSFLPFYNHNLDVNSEEEFKLLSGDEYSNFAQKYARSPDDIVDPLIHTTEHITSGYPFDVNLYRSTVLSIVPESEVGQSEKIWLTEKTWKTIANCHPFIIVGQHGTLQYLKTLGFRTFEQYLLHQDYDFDLDINSQLNKVVENTEYFLQNFKKHRKEILQDTKHNLNTLEQLIKSNIIKHEMFQNKHFLFTFLDNTNISNQLACS